MCFLDSLYLVKLYLFNLTPTLFFWAQKIWNLIKEEGKSEIRKIKNIVILDYKV